MLITEDSTIHDCIDRIDELFEVYEPKLFALIVDLQDAVSPIEPGVILSHNDPEYALSFFTERGGRKGQGYHFCIEIKESHVHGDEPGGMSFRFDITEQRGLIVGGIAPFNYTEDVWVDMFDCEQVEERYNLFERAVQEFIPYAMDFLNEHESSN